MLNKSLKSFLQPFNPIWAARHWRSYKNTTEHFNKYYAEKINLNYNCRNEKILIYTADGTTQAGGLADRLRGMVSLYYLSKLIGVDYRIRFNSPFSLAEVVLPNKYNWIIQEDEVSFNPKNVINYNHWCGNTKVDIQSREASETVKFFLKKYKQLHYTTNIFIADHSYGELFDELFQPSICLRTEIERYTRDIGGDYIAVTFRFQQLLGDFIEGDFRVLSKQEQDRLTSRCLKHLLAIHLENQNCKILVTSDSKSFLAQANNFDFTFVIPGDIYHLDFSSKTNSTSYTKSFLDYYMLVEAKKIYLVVDGPMYKSGFPERAAIHKKIPFIVKNF